MGTINTMPFTVAQLLNPPTYDEVKTTVFDRLEAAGFTAIRSYAPESLPIGLVETESQTLDQENQAGAFVVKSGYNSLAEKDALDELSHELYDDERNPGTQAQGFVTLSDPRSQGPFTLSPLSVSFSRGVGGLVYNGVNPNGVDPLVLPKGGSVNVYVQAEAVGSDYNAGVGEINTFTRGRLTGVVATNPAGWQSGIFGVSGTNPEEDPSLRARNTTKWGTLSQFKPTTMVQSGYENAARNASNQVTRVRVVTNADLTDPGKVDVIIAGDAGALSVGVVATVQIALAPLQLGGPNIAETAKCVVTSAVNLAVTVAGIVTVDAVFNTPAFLAQINIDLATWFKSFLIGGGKLGRVSYERILGIVSFRAGLTNNVVLDATNVTVNGGTSDLPIAFNQVPVLTSLLTLQSL